MPISCPLKENLPHKAGQPLSRLLKDSSADRGLRCHLCPFRPGNFTYRIPVSSSTPLHLSLTLQMK
jgi:hypothetical protein